jgi:hypothetical protein
MIGEEQVWRGSLYAISSEIYDAIDDGRSARWRLPGAVNN